MKILGDDKYMNKHLNIFKEFDKHLLNDEKPSKYFNEIKKTGIFYNVYPFTFLGDLIGVPQSLQHHPEGDVWNHTMLVVDYAAKKKQISKEPRTLMWAALLHDLGKARTTRLRKGKITSYNHDKVGKELVLNFLEYFDEDKNFIKKVSALVRWHMQSLFVVKNMPYAEIENMLKDVEPREIALLTECDRLGRGGLTEEKINSEKKSIDLFLYKITKR
ncbi:multifunctional CCA protein [Clostridium tepidiprofundi DSM 19306]|uniref:Multifunctional CCA protein n=1 Tax=Clostridium tepidiprofundi DSM 19306 TaxID=1121338 RepID=A0A151B7V6_9CLOT|nr:HD domain-containing protein [Clostridium tepidiprofundi]KYH36005.1 multifunctional CCA protein [Clostridium tepidiprofundi DSM 19306]